MCSRIKYIFKNSIVCRKYFHVACCFLERGFYRFNNDKIFKVSFFEFIFSFFSLKTRFNGNHILFGGGINFLSCNKERECYLSGGFNKKVLIFSSFVINIFKNSKDYSKAIKNYRHVSSFPFYVAKELEFDDKKLIIITERINGEKFNDDTHAEQFTDFYIKRIKKIPFKIIDGIPYMLSHGDLSMRNILWVKDKPVLVDLDDLEYQPLFSDLIHFYIVGYNSKKIFYTFKMYKKQILDFCKRNNVELNESNFYDQLLYQYFSWQISRSNDNILYFTSIDKNFSFYFPLTAKLILKSKYKQLI